MHPDTAQPPQAAAQEPPQRRHEPSTAPGSTHSATWPPAPTTEAPWHTRTLDVAGLGRVEVTVRHVRLWGRPVLVDGHAAVWCSSCRTFVDLEQLLEVPFTGHPFDSRPRRGVRRLLEHDDPPPPRSRHAHARDTSPERW